MELLKACVVQVVLKCFMCAIQRCTVVCIRKVLKFVMRLLEMAMIRLNQRMHVTVLVE